MIVLHSVEPTWTVKVHKKVVKSGLTRPEANEVVERLEPCFRNISLFQEKSQVGFSFVNYEGEIA